MLAVSAGRGGEGGGEESETDDADDTSLSLSPDVNDPAFREVTFDDVKKVYAEQVRGLLDGGVDLLLPETSIDTLNLKAPLGGSWGPVWPLGAPWRVFFGDLRGSDSSRGLAGLGGLLGN